MKICINSKKILEKTKIIVIMNHKFKTNTRKWRKILCSKNLMQEKLVFL